MLNPLPLKHMHKIHHVVTREALFCFVLIHCIISCRQAEFRQAYFAQKTNLPYSGSGPTVS